MKKIISFTLSCLLLFTGCASNTNQDTSPSKNEPVVSEMPADEKINIKVVTPYGTPSLSAVKMLVEEPNIDENVNIIYETLESSDILSATLINGEADIAIVPTNLAATLYNKGLDYKIVGTGVWGNFYIISSESVSSLNDLVGQNLTTTGRNLTPDAILRFVLKNNNIDPDNDLNIEYFAGSSELATNFIAKESNISVAPQPVLTNMLIKRDDASLVIDLQEEWAKLTEFDSYPQASLIVSANLLNDNPEFVAKFIDEYESSVAWVNENPSKAGEYYESLEIGLSATIIENAVPFCSLNFVRAKDAKDSIDAYLAVLFEFNPKLIGEKMTDEGLYFEQ